MRHTRLALATSLFVTLTACYDAARPAKSAPVYPTVGAETGGTLIDLGSCTRCHGDADQGNAAPPLSTRGARDTADRAVGAHQRHVGQLTLRAPVACDECHVVPLSASDAGHIGNAEATVTFGSPRSPGLAVAKGAAPTVG